MLSPNPYDFSRKKQITDFFSNKFILGIVLSFLVIRLLTIFIPPQFTTDLARSLFYGKHFWNVGFNVYKLTPIQIDPNFNVIDPTTGTLAWTHNTYDYGLISLLYYAIIGILPVSISTQMIIAKFILNIVDVILVFFLILLFPENKEIPIVFWVVMIPFSSIEGQPLSFTLLFFIMSIYFYKEDKKSLAYVFVALGFHWKYVTLLLLPYYILNDIKEYYSEENKGKKLATLLKPMVIFCVLFFLLMFPLLVSPYILSYISFGGNLPVISLPWNPYYLGYPWTISSILLAILVVYILSTWYSLRNNSKITYELGFIPILGLFGFLLIYKYAFPWYWMWAIPLFALVPAKKRELFIIYVSICLIAAIEFINWTVGFPFIINLLFVFNS